MKDYRLFDHICPAANGNELFVYSQLMGALFSINIETGKTDCLCFLNISDEYREFRAVVPEGDYLFILPYFSNVIKKYGRFDKSFQDIYITDGFNSSSLTGGLVRDENIYMNNKNPQIVIMDKNNLNTKILKIDEEEFGVPKDTFDGFWTESYLCGGNIYIPLDKSNKLLVIDENDSLDYITLGNADVNVVQSNIYVTPDKILSMYLDADNNLWMVRFSIDGFEKALEKIEISHQGEDNSFKVAKYSYDSWIIYPFDSDLIYVINNEVRNYKLSRKYRISNAVSLDDGTVCGLDGEQGLLVIVRDNGRSVIEKELYFDDESKNVFEKMLAKSMVNGNRQISEDEQLYTLNRFVEGLTF